VFVSLTKRNVEQAMTVSLPAVPLRLIVQGLWALVAAHGICRGRRLRLSTVVVYCCSTCGWRTNFNVLLRVCRKRRFYVVRTNQAQGLVAWDFQPRCYVTIIGREFCSFCTSLKRSKNAEHGRDDGLFLVIDRYAVKIYVRKDTLN